LYKSFFILYAHLLTSSEDAMSPSFQNCLFIFFDRLCHADRPGIHHDGARGPPQDEGHHRVEGRTPAVVFFLSLEDPNPWHLQNKYFFLGHVIIVTKNDFFLRRFFPPPYNCGVLFLKRACIPKTTRPVSDGVMGSCSKMFHS
jgi:hypothetical protein